MTDSKCQILYATRNIFDETTLPSLGLLLELVSSRLILASVVIYNTVHNFSVEW